MIINRIIGHEKKIDLLRDSMIKKRPPQALLFSGPSGVGKKLIALYWAQGLLCAQLNRPCGKCSTCIRVEKQSHPDLFILSQSDSIKIENTRDLQKFVSLRAFEGVAKVIIIDNSELFTMQAANSMLKTLEEPPENTFFILVTREADLLLETIRSRCQRLNFGSLGLSEVSKITGITDNWILENCQGRCDLALKYSDPEFQEVKSKLMTLLDSIGDASLGTTFPELAALSKEKEMARFSTMVINSALRAKSLAVCAEAGQHELSPEQWGKLQYLNKISQGVLVLERDLEHNVHKGLSFENFWLKARESISKIN